jgi:PST family polysaccharide transporter
MTFARASLLNAMAVAVRLLSGLAINKLLAVIVGPAGFAMVGQLQNLVAITSTLATGATTQGVTKFTAEHHADRESQIRLWRTATRIALLCALGLGALLILARAPLAGWLLGDPALGSVIGLLGLSLPFIAGNLLLMAILNGVKDMPGFVLAGIVGALASLVLTVGLTLTWNLTGALAALATSQGVAFFVVAWFSRRHDWFRWSMLIGPIDPVMARGLGGFIAMAATTALVAPTTQILTRNWIGQTFGPELAGCWEGMARLSAMQLLFFTSSLSAWYLPRLSEVQSGPELLGAVHHVLVRILPVVALSSFLVWALRDWIILLLFEARFQPMADLFAAQMIGDTLKIASWVYAFVMIGRGLVRTFIVTEILFGAAQFGLTTLFAGSLGFQGASIGHLATYGLYVVAMVAIVHHHCRTQMPAASGQTG